MQNKNKKAKNDLNEEHINSVMFRRIISRKLSFKICLECKTVCPCIETKSCEYNDFKYSIKYAEWYKKYVPPPTEPKEDKEDIIYY